MHLVSRYGPRYGQKCQPGCSTPLCLHGLRCMGRNAVHLSFVGTMIFACAVLTQRLRPQA